MHNRTVLDIRNTAMKNTNTKEWILTLLLAAACNYSADAQRWFKSSSLEFGLIGGFSHYMGELNENSLETRGFKPCVGLITRYTPNQRWTFRLSAQYGGFEARDDWYEDQEDPERRNLSVESTLWDFTGAGEYNFVTLDMRDSRGVIPYLFGGISVFRFNPHAEFEYDPNGAMAAYLGDSYTSLADRDGELVELQPLGTEGQETTEFNERERYALTQLSIPLGAGVKFKLSHKWNLGIEYGFRYTFTDYMDDVSDTYVDPVRLQSQYGPMSAAMSDRSPTLHDELGDNVRGNPNNNDTYGILGVTLTYRIYGKRPNCPSF